MYSEQLWGQLPVGAASARSQCLLNTKVGFWGPCPQEVQTPPPDTHLEVAVTLRHCLPPSLLLEPWPEGSVLPA